MIAVVVELGQRRAFASALEWPGWSRSGHDEARALEQLAAYALRYQRVAAHVGHPVAEVDPAQGLGVEAFEVVERLAGDATTDFGAPGKAAPAESAPLDAGGAYRRVLLLRSCWEYLDGVAGKAPLELAKGPRGGGRDREAVLAHVAAAEVAYARKLGVRDRQVLTSVDATRQAVAGVLAAPSDGAPLTERGWTPRYCLRRLAWHVLDHAWEIEDRSPD